MLQSILPTIEVLNIRRTCTYVSNIVLRIDSQKKKKKTSNLNHLYFCN